MPRVSLSSCLQIESEALVKKEEYSVSTEKLPTQAELVETLELNFRVDGNWVSRKAGLTRTRLVIALLLFDLSY